MKLTNIIITILIITIVPVVTLSCNPVTVKDKKSIVVTYSILGSIVKEMVGDRATVTVSIPDGLDPHEWEPSARNIEAINKADLVIENGLGLESGIEKTLRAARDNGVKFFTAADHITVRYAGSGEGIPSGDQDQATGAADPHLWLDPVSVKSVVAALVPVLKTTLKIDASTQAAGIMKRLDNLNDEIYGIVSQINPENRKLVTGHESMGYFAQRYNFKLVGVIVPGLSSQASVSAADLAALKKAIQDNGVKAIFTELGTSAATARVIMNETGVKVIELSTHVLPSDGSYFTFMRNMANIITEGLK